MKEQKFHEGTLFIANGFWFHKLEAVEEYAKKHGWRITNITKRRGQKNNFPYQAICDLSK